MRTISLVALGFGVMLATASSVSAAAFSVNFCPADDSCPDNVSEASLTFDEILAGDDPNDYILTLKIVGSAGSPEYIDSVQFSIGGVDTPTGYEGKPSLQAAPAQGTPWVVYWDMVAGNPADCSADTSQGEGVCAGSTGNGASTDGINIWQFLVDLDDDEDPLGVGTQVDLRARFKKIGPRGSILPGGIMSPEGGGYLDTGSNETSSNESSTNETSANETSTVPEPAMLSLFGLALAAAAHRMKRK